MTLNDLEWPIHLKVRLVRLLWVSDSETHRCSQRGRRGVGWRACAPPCGQLMHCFSAVAELRVIDATSCM